MTKTHRLILSVFILAVFLFSIISVSAYTFYESYRSNSEKTTGNSYGQGYTKASNYEKTTATTYDNYGGYSKTTSYVKTVSESPRYGQGNYNSGYNSGFNTNYNSGFQKYGSSCSNYYYGSECSGYPSSNWRYQDVYNTNSYQKSYNTYTTPYYYQPRYDSDSGYYNWRY